MKVNIIKIDYTDIHKAISREEFNGNRTQYCIMNEDTFKLLEKENENIFFRKDMPYKVCGLKVAICPELNFGELDIV